MRHPKEYAQFAMKDATRSRISRKSFPVNGSPISTENVNVSMKRKSKSITIEIVAPEKQEGTRKSKRQKKAVLNGGDLTVSEVRSGVGAASTSAATDEAGAADKANKKSAAGGRRQVKRAAPAAAVVVDDDPDAELARQQLLVERNRKFRDLLVEMVGTTTVPAMILENEVFRKLVNFLDPSINCPSRETLGREVIRTNQEIKREMRDLLTAAERITIGADICMKKTVACGYIGVIAYFYSKEQLKYYALALGLREVKAPHDTTEVNSVLSQILQDYGIEQRKMIRMIVGNGGRIDSDGYIIAETEAEQLQASYYLNIHFCGDAAQSQLNCNETCYVQVVANEAPVRRLSCFVHNLETVWKRHERKSHFDDTVSASYLDYLHLHKKQIPRSLQSRNSAMINDFLFA